MRIVVSVPGAFRIEPWVDAVKGALPEAEVSAWDKAPANWADYAIVWAPEGALFEDQRALKAVFNLGAGVDALLALAALPPGLPVVRLGDAGMSVQMAEYVCQAVIRFARGLGEYEREMKAGIWSAKRAPARSDFPVGVMGLGAIGARVARALAAFDYPVLGWSRSPKTVAGVASYCGPAGLDAFLRASRILVCALPLTPDTRGILCRATLEKLRPEGYLINVGRGAHLIEDDLLELLDEGVIKGATLDVFTEEPLRGDHPFLRQPSITLTPHISAVTNRHLSVEQIAQKIKRFEAGAAIDGVVERTRGY